MCVFPDGSRMEAGPAGLSAAVYGASECLKTVVIERFAIGDQASMHFARFARAVTIVIRSESLKATLSNYLLDRINASPNVHVLTQTEVTGLDGDRILQSITLTDRKTGRNYTAPTHWLFVCIGGEPHTEWSEDVGIIRDEGGYLVTDRDLVEDGRMPASWPLKRSPYQVQTSMPGLFAAGDVRHGSVKRCASAVGEGAMAIASIHRYLAVV